jgi:hypothetical protein
MHCITTYVSVAIVVTFASHVSGDLVNPDVPDWRGDSGAFYYGWNSFTNAFDAPNFNDAGDTGGMLFNFADGAMITSTGNIYNMNTGLNIHVYGYGSVDQAVMSFASQGTEMQYSNVSMWVSDGITGEYFSADSWGMNYYEPVEGLGANVTATYAWDVSDYEGVISEWAIFINGTEAHNVLDAVSVDVFSAPIPSPGVLGVFALLGCRRRRRS